MVGGPSPACRMAAAPERPALTRMLARAFADDPTTVWIFPDPGPRPRRLAQMIAWELAASRLTQGELVTVEGLGAAALWQAPQPAAGPPGLSWWAQARLTAQALRVFGRRLPVVATTFASLMRELPPQPYRYLSILGTDPALQGQGLGSALLQQGTQRSDLEQVPTLLHTATARDVAFYARRGFAVIGQTRPPGGPTLWAMRREPGAS